MTHLYRGYILEVIRKDRSLVAYRVTSLRHGTVLEEGTQSGFQVPELMAQCRSRVDLELARGNDGELSGL